MNWLWDNIHLKKADRAGMFAFLSILFTILLLKWYLVVYYQPKADIDHGEVFTQVEYAMIEHPPIQNNTNRNYSKSNYKKKHKKKKSTTPAAAKNEVTKERLMFEFDPNTLSSDSLVLIGLNPYAADNIKKYREKGGQFHHPNDLQKIYGIKAEEFDQILPFIKIRKSGKSTGTTEKRKEKWPVNKTSVALRSIDINKADTTDFKSLKGIGSVYANRIVKFRNSLGGYFTIDQIKDVWGISDSLYNAIEPYLSTELSPIEKKNINTLNKEVLVKHPYIDWKKAKVILSYKRMHGDYKTMDEFEKLHGLDDSFVDTLKQYFLAQ